MPEDTPKTAVTISFGLFKFFRVPLCLRMTGHSFQEVIPQACNLACFFVFTYVGDLHVASAAEEEHRHHLRLLFQGFNPTSW